MNISTDIKSVTYLKSRAADPLEQINETHRPVIIIQNGEPRAILQDPKSYESMRTIFCGIGKLRFQPQLEIINKIGLSSIECSGKLSSIRKRFEGLQ